MIVRKCCEAQPQEFSKNNNINAQNNPYPSTWTPQDKNKFTKT